MFLKLQTRLNPARHRRHTPTHADIAGPPPCLSLPQRGFDQTEPFMGNDWRMHPLLSLQICLSEREGRRGEEGRMGWRRRGAGAEGEGGEERREESMCSGVFHLVLAGSRGAAPAESCT